MKCGHSKFCVELRNHFTTKTTFKPIYSFYYSGNFLERGIKTPNKSLLKIVTTRRSNIMILSWSRRLNINLIIAETEKVEEKNMEVLVAVEVLDLMDCDVSVIVEEESGIASLLTFFKEIRLSLTIPPNGFSTMESLIARIHWSRSSWLCAANLKSKGPVQHLIECVYHLKCLWDPCTTAPRESVLALLMVLLLPTALKISKTQSLVSL